MANIKGTYIGNTVKALRAHREAALRELPPELHHYLERRILTSQWYPEADHFALLSTLVKVAHLAGPDPYAEVGRISADRDMRSTYKVFLRENDPTGTFRHLASVWSLAHDHGKVEATVDGDSAGTLELKGATYCQPEFCRLNSAFYARTLEMAGARRVEVEHPECQSTGDATCKWRMRWQEPAT